MIGWRFAPKKWRARVDAYELRTDANGKKEAVYKGNLYCLTSDARVRGSAVFFPLSMVAAFVVGGADNSPLSRTAYAVLPFILMFLPLAFLCVYCVPLALGATTFTERGKDKITGKLRLATAAVLIFSLAALAGTVVRLAAGGGLSLTESAVFLICCVYNSLAPACFLSVARILVTSRLSLLPRPGENEIYHI